MWQTVYVTQIARVVRGLQAALAREGFLVRVRCRGTDGAALWEVAVPRDEAALVAGRIGLWVARRAAPMHAGVEPTAVIATTGARPHDMGASSRRAGWRACPGGDVARAAGALGRARRPHLAIHGVRLPSRWGGRGAAVLRGRGLCSRGWGAAHLQPAYSRVCGPEIGPV